MYWKWKARASSPWPNPWTTVFTEACRLILECGGRVVVTGMGKSGHIGGKIAATLASTGTPAFFVHPGEASHGDLGMITADDLMLAISHSGETPEILAILPIIKRMNVGMIAITADGNSTIGKDGDDQPAYPGHHRSLPP